jgi:mono/diheme cytochrome c family protein
MALALCTLALVGMTAALSCTSAARKVEMTPAEKIARGRYISLICACNDCHTPGTFYGAPDTTRMLSGSELGWHGPWGVSYPRNLTPDQQTGIGSWTEDQIVTAVRIGQRPDKTPILPPMPWPMYANLSDEDAYALAAYLKSIPPVTHKAPDRLPPSPTVTVPALSFPPPPAWDAPKTAPADTAAK